MQPTEREFIIETFGRMTYAEQAAALGLSARQVRSRVQSLVREHEIDPSYRFWNDRDVLLLREMISDGKTIADISRTLKRTPCAVQDKIKKEGGIGVLRSYFTPLNIADFMRLFSLSRGNARVVHKWIERGWLNPRSVRQTRHIRISHDAILAFLACEASWCAWSPQQITDPDLRIEAQRLRNEADGQWMRLTEWARIHHYAENTVGNWARAGTIRAEKWGCVWYIWIDVLQEET